MKLIAGDEKESMTKRGLSFDMILAAPMLDFIDSATRKDQKYLVVRIGDYAVVVPCKSLKNNEWLMITAWYDRKFTKEYIK